MVEGNASMYLASPRVAEKVTGELTTLEEMGGAVMHATAGLQAVQQAVAADAKGA
jgi:acetyl-CoA carboxylase carboxyltransferase component